MINLSRLIDKLTLFLIGASVFGVAISYHKIYLFHVIGLILLTSMVFVTIVRNFKIKYVRLPTKYHYLFYLMVIWYSLSIAWSPNPLDSIIYIIYIICGSFLSLTIIYYVNVNSKKLYKLFLVSSLCYSALMIVSLFEVFTGFRLPHSPYSSFSHIPTGFFGNPNNLATTMSLVFPFCLFNSNIVVKILGCSFIFIIVGSTDSRANILAIIIMLMVYILFYKKSLKLQNIVKGILILICLISLLSVNSYGDRVKTLVAYEVENSLNALYCYLNGDDIDTGNSIAVRRQLIINGLDALERTKGIGVGGGGSLYFAETSGLAVYSMHNFWIELLVEGGVPFFLIFVMWYAQITRELFRFTRAEKGPVNHYFSSSISLSLIGFVPGAISASSVIYLLPMWTFLGFAVANININRNMMAEKKNIPEVNDNENSISCGLQFHTHCEMG